jgi:starch synthase
MDSGVSTRVLFLTAEMAPLVKVGGLGDVAGSLPKALRKARVDVRVALPYYQSIRKQKVEAKRLVPLGDGAAVWEAGIAGVPVYLVQHDAWFGRSETYGYPDDRERFLAFCDALIAGAEKLGWQPDVLHLNDWHPGFLSTRLIANPLHLWALLPRVATVHNLGYPARFDPPFASRHRFANRALTPPEGLSREIAYSALGQALLHADQISTVSPAYAQEIQSARFGGVLSPLLRRRRERLTGIMNGIDVKEFNPARDKALAARFDLKRLDKRAKNKAALQKAMGLPVDERVPLLGMVSRLVVQKGPDLVAGAVERLLRDKAALQLVVLGTGEEQYEQQLVRLAERYPEQVAVRIAFDVDLGQLIYGGSDMFLMPSRYEPGGLGQLISMRYGCIPIVRRTGGLADSVEPYDGRGHGTGFAFERPAAGAFAAVLERAVNLFKRRDSWRKLQERAMAVDVSWEAAARQYAALYERAQSDRLEAGL